MTETELSELEALLADATHACNFGFRSYRRMSLGRRISRRATRLGLTSIAEYRKYIEAHEEELTVMLDTILINTTGFFRDAAAWQALAQQVFTRWVDDDAEIRIWCAGCASGEEVWTTAILLHMLLGEAQYQRRVRLYATDIDTRALERARAARYGAANLANVPDVYRTRYFVHCGPEYVVRPDLRESVEIQVHDLVRDPPIPALDLIICRNTMMYFTADAQNTLLSLLHGALNDPGCLFLGRTELPLTRVRLFRPLDLGSRIFVRVAHSPVRESARRSNGVRDITAECGARLAGRRSDAISHNLRRFNGSISLQHVERVRSPLSYAPDVFPFVDCKRSFK